MANPASLHDVASGSNGPCSQPLETEGLYDCTALEEAAECEYQPICLAGPGYDGPTGVGSPDGIGAFEPTGVPERKPQVIAFTSSAPAAAVVGGPEYAPTATASSRLPVSFSTATPETCPVVSASVAFLGAGTCTIDANQAGNGEYRRADYSGDSRAVMPGPARAASPSGVLCARIHHVLARAADQQLHAGGRPKHQPQYGRAHVHGAGRERGDDDVDADLRKRELRRRAVARGLPR